MKYQQPEAFFPTDKRGEREEAQRRDKVEGFVD